MPFGCDIVIAGTLPGKKYRLLSAYRTFSHMCRLMFSAKLLRYSILLLKRKLILTLRLEDVSGSEKGVVCFCNITACRMFSFPSLSEAPRLQGGASWRICSGVYTPSFQDCTFHHIEIYQSIKVVYHRLCLIELA